MILDHQIKLNLSTLQKIGTPMSEILGRTNNAKVPSLKELKEQCSKDEIIVAISTCNPAKSRGGYEPKAVVKPLTQEWEVDHLRDGLIKNRTANGAFIYKIDRGIAQTASHQSTQRVFDVEESYVTKNFDKRLAELSQTEGPTH